MLLVPLLGSVRPLLAFCAAFLFAACAVQAPAGGGPYPRFAEYAGREVREVELAGDLVLREDSLRAVLITRGPECGLLFLPICPFGLFREEYNLDLEALARDVVRLQLAYRDAGYYGTRVLPAVDPVGDEVRVRFAIEPGDRVVLRDLVVSGTEGVVPPDELRERLPLEEGGPFSRRGFLASADTIQAALFRRGYAYAEVLRNYSLDTIADVAEAEFVAVPGPLVTIDTVLILGGERLGEKTARRQLTFREGNVLRASELARSQRNLYDLGIVSFASVELAPDSLQQDTALSRATVVVRLVEAPQYLVDASAGYGTVDCLRAQVRRVNRNFLGGARRLELSASTSKVGVGFPTDLGLDRSWLCGALRPDGVRDRFSDTINYRLAAEFEQPDLFGTRTSAVAGAFVERTSEVATYLRQAIGSQFSLARQVAPQTLVTTTLRVERGRTDAESIFFCVTLDQCTTEEIAPLRQYRWSNSLGSAAVLDRVRLEQAVPVGGYRARAGVEWASELLGSDDRYLRLVAEGTAFRRLRPGWTIGARLLGGTFLQGQIGALGEYIPPERRFYAGGPNSVRGFEQNAVGPGAYVQDLAALDSAELAGTADTVALIREETNPRRSSFGGTETVVASVEVQAPSPLLPEFLRLAAFVDAGYLDADLSRSADQNQTRQRILVTPGAGVRFGTPIGPIRFDVAYNPYSQLAGPLYVFDSEGQSGDLRRLTPEFAPRERSGLLDRLQFHIAVGQAF